MTKVEAWMVHCVIRTLAAGLVGGLYAAGLISAVTLVPVLLVLLWLTSMTSAIEQWRANLWKGRLIEERTKGDDQVRP